MKKEKAEAFKKILTIAKSQKAKEIYADTNGHEKPPKLKTNHFNKSYTADAILRYGDKSDIYLVETSLNKKELADKIGRWIMFSAEARRQKGELFIYAADSVNKRINELIDSKMIRAEVVKI